MKDNFINKHWYVLFEKNNFERNKKLKEIKNYSFNNLHKIIYPNLTPKQILKFRKYIKKFVTLKSHTILDYGSGFGSLFLNFKKNLYFSYEPVDIFRKIQKKNFSKYKNFYLVNKKFIKKKDVVFCISIFQYIKNKTAAKKLLKYLLELTNKKLIIIDIKDSEKKKEYKINQIKRAKITVSNYNIKYAKTKILFYNKKFFENILNNTNFTYEFKKLKYLTNSKYSFDLIIHKSK